MLPKLRPRSSGLTLPQLRAITVLQRDLSRERQRIQDAEKEKEKAAVASRTRSKSLSLSPTSTRAPLPGSATDAIMDEPPSHTQMSPPPSSGGSGSGPPGRRGSAISLSSLSRPAFPHKLDLSSTTLRMTAEEASLFSSGPLASPVTLAPKSARPGNADIPPDLMAAFEAAADANSRPVDIDLTVPDTEPSDNNGNPAPSHDVNMNMGSSLGNSADKPIELDLDSMDIDISNMSDLFGDATDSNSADANAGLFSPPSASHDLPLSSNASTDGKEAKQEPLGMELLDALSAVGDAAGHEDLFASFSQTNPQTSNQNLPQSNTSDALSIPVDSSSSGGASVPSPGTILASFTTSQLNANDHSATSDLQNLPEGQTPFDLDSLDLSHVFGSDGGGGDNNITSEFEELLKTGGFGEAS